MKKLYRSTSNKKIGGVCAGLAEYFNIDPLIIRLGFVALTLMSGMFMGVIVYIICMLTIPEDQVII